MIPMRDGVKLHTKIFAPRQRREAAALPHPAHAVRHRRSGQAARRLLQGARRRRLHLRVPGPPRQVRLGGRLRDAAAGAGAGRHEGARRRHRHLRHDRVAARRTCRATTAASGCSASRTTAGRPSWPRSSRTRRSPAISPQASPADMWLGDDFHHNGAFRLSYGFEYADDDGERQGREAVRASIATTPTTGTWRSARSPTSTRTTSTARSRPGTTSWRHPDYDEFWKRQTMIPHIRDVKVPTLNVAGWWDQEDFYGPLQIYAALEKHDTAEPQLPRRRALEPRRLDRPDGSKLGAISFGSATVEVLPRGGAGAVVRLLPEGQEARSTFRRPSRSRPGRIAGGAGRRGRRPRARRPRALYFGADEHAVLRSARRSGRRPKPSTATSPIPAHPVPYRQRPIQPTYFPGGSKWSTWLRRGPALRRRPRRRAQLGDAAADRGRHDRRRGRGASLRLDDRHRRRLDRQADRRLSGAAIRKTGTSPAIS